MRGEKLEVRGEKPIIALLAGSRKQEIKDNLPAMIEATRHLAGQYGRVHRRRDLGCAAGLGAVTDGA